MLMSLNGMNFPNISTAEGDLLPDCRRVTVYRKRTPTTGVLLVLPTIQK